MIRVRHNAIELVILFCLGGLLLLSSCGRRARVKTWEQAHAEAMNDIAKRQQWPASPEAVCEAFWEARRAKDYKEMEILWPGSGSYNWPEICKDDPDVKYVFGKANETGTSVPYAEEGYFKEHGSYNLTMVMGSFKTPRGLRYYIVSGN
jgi:hypothetical protein